MARVINNTLTDGLRGTIGDFVFCQRGGKTYVRRRPAALSTHTRAQRTMRCKFGEASTLATIDMKDLSRLAMWEEIFAHQKRYSTLRGMITAYYQKALKAPNATAAKLAKLARDPHIDTSILQSMGISTHTE